MKRSIRVFKTSLLIVTLFLIILFFKQPLVKAAEPAYTVAINGETLNNEYKIFS